MVAVGLLHVMVVAQYCDSITQNAGPFFEAHVVWPRWAIYVEFLFLFGGHLDLLFGSFFDV